MIKKIVFSDQGGSRPPVHPRQAASRIRGRTRAAVRIRSRPPASIRVSAKRLDRGVRGAGAPLVRPAEKDFSINVWVYLVFLDLLRLGFWTEVFFWPG